MGCNLSAPVIPKPKVSVKNRTGTHVLSNNSPAITDSKDNSRPIKSVVNLSNQQNHPEETSSKYQTFENRLASPKGSVNILKTSPIASRKVVSKLQNEVQESIVICNNDSDKKTPYNVFFTPSKSAIDNEGEKLLSQPEMTANFNMSDNNSKRTANLGIPNQDPYPLFLKSRKGSKQPSISFCKDYTLQDIESQQISNSNTSYRIKTFEELQYFPQKSNFIILPENIRDYSCKPADNETEEKFGIRKNQLKKSSCLIETSTTSKYLLPKGFQIKGKSKNEQSEKYNVSTVDRILKPIKHCTIDDMSFHNYSKIGQNQFLSPQHINSQEENIISETLMSRLGLPIENNKKNHSNSASSQIQNISSKSDAIELSSSEIIRRKKLLGRTQDIFSTLKTKK